MIVNILKWVGRNWLAMGYAYYMCFYLISTIRYSLGDQDFENEMVKDHPWLARQGFTKGKTLCYLIGPAIILGLVGGGLLLHWLVALIVAFVLSGYETYRGATYYLKEDEGEAVKHMIVHGFICGHLFTNILSRWI